MKNTAEREISLVSLFWDILLGWRRLAALGILFAVLVSGLKYSRDDKAYQSVLRQQAAAEQSQEEPETEIVLTKEEAEAVENAKGLQRQINTMKTYLQESMLMNLDAYHENALILQFYVDTHYTFNYTQENEENYLDHVVAAYCNYAESGNLARAIMSEVDLGIEENYVNELISTDRSAGVFQVFVVADEPEALEQMQSVITAAMASQTGEISEKIGSHTLELLSAQVLVRSDADLVNRQKLQNDILETYRSRLISAKGSMSEQQLEALGIELKKEQAEEGTEGEEGTVQVVPVKPSFGVKYVILGVLVGIFLACVWVALEALFSARLQETEELSGLYGIRLLGELNGEKRKKRFLPMVDTFILKMKNRNKKQMSREQQQKIICSNLEIACKKDGIDRIYMTGSELEKIDTKWLSQIAETLRKSGITVCTGENIIYDAGALKEMAKIGQVVFVEQIGVSLYEEVEKELRISRENAVSVIGSIVVA